MVSRNWTNFDRSIAPNNQVLEVGISGRDGLVGVPLILDTDRTPHRIFMQVVGTGYYIDAEDMSEILDKHGSIRKLLLRYVQTYYADEVYSIGKYCLYHRRAASSLGV
jgi:hypothetical protein